MVCVLKGDKRLSGWRGWAVLVVAIGEPTPRKWVLLVWKRREYSAARVLSVAER
jgi:hypothetical protein